MSKNKSIKLLFIVLAISLFVAFFWNNVPAIKNTVHLILDPTAGALLNYNPTLGVILVSAIISCITMLLQKFTTDQDALRQIKKEQKILQEQMKEFKDNPEKMMELQKKSFEFVPRTLDITIRPLMYTSVPIILFFRWFNDYFTTNPHTFFGFMSWIWVYIIASLIFSSIFKKLFKVA